MKYEMSIQDILRYLPHRHPFLLIDRVLEIEEGKSIVVLKNVTVDEPFFNGHFPEKPVMPGVLILEAMAQAAVVLAYKTTNTSPEDGSIYFFAGIDKARFRRIVEPGDQLILKVEAIRSIKGIWKLSGVATVDGEEVCSAELMSARKEKEE